LTYLHDVLDAPIPVEVLKRVQEMPTAKLERLEYEGRISPWAARGPWEEVRSKYLRYALLMHTAGSRPSLLGFQRFLMVTWGLQHMWQLPLSAVSRTAYRIREMSAWRAGAMKNRQSRN
jgi:hypothetical protein